MIIKLCLKERKKNMIIMKKIVHFFVLRATIPSIPIQLPFHKMHRYDRLKRGCSGAGPRHSRSVKGIYFVIYGSISEFTDKGQFQYLTNLKVPQEGTYLHTTQFLSLR